jgi:exosome complex RNA-binding protein Rrp4
MGWKLDAITKAGLDLGDKPDDKDIRKALELRGVDCSKGDIRIFVANNEDIWIGGAKEKVALAKAIFELSQKGYQVKRREKSHQ